MDNIPIHLIVTMTENGTIADKGVIPWEIPGEQKYFKDHTVGSAVLMGRKTWEALNYAPLPGRLNIVLSHQGNFSAAGAIVVTNYTEAVDAAMASSLARPVLWVMGGAEVLNHAQWMADKAYVTVLHDHFDGDVKFATKRDGKPLEITTHEAEVQFHRTTLAGTAPTQFTKKLRYSRVIIGYGPNDKLMS
jgi:dihydrofolate reductase